ncbi:MAG: hypothetical protein LBF88_09120 [Planctomycetaceae bacterium]|jgi:hypothetical protein|nr:hypothetical protein [Planctomycetaceae bacterium]
MDKFTKQVLDFQTRLQGLANSLGEQIVESLNATDADLLKTLQKQLKTMGVILILRMLR